MKSITPSIRGLASSLLLNVGLTQAAEKLDPVATNQVKLANAGGALASMVCAPCAFSVRRR